MGCTPYNPLCTKYIGGDLSITKFYRFRAILRSREDLYIYFEKPIRIDNIEFSSIEPQKSKVSVLFTVKADSDREAKIKAEKFVDSLCTAVLLSTNIAVSVDSIDIVGVREIRELESERRKTIKIHEILNKKDELNKDEVSVGLGLSESHIRNIVKIAGKIESFNELISRFLRWYRRALLKEDPIDRFIKLWIAFEIWAAYKGYKSGKMSEKAKMVNALMKECKFSRKDADEIYSIRSALFHSGAYDKAVNKLPQLEKCLATIIVSEVKRTIQQ